MYGAEQAVSSTQKVDQYVTSHPSVGEDKSSVLPDLGSAINKAQEFAKYELYQLIYSLEDRGLLRPEEAMPADGGVKKAEKPLSGIEQFMNNVIDEQNSLAYLAQRTRKRLP